jgi:hypothetical protein
MRIQHFNSEDIADICVALAAILEELAVRPPAVTPSASAIDYAGARRNSELA